MALVLVTVMVMFVFLFNLYKLVKPKLSHSWPVLSLLILRFNNYRIDLNYRTQHLTDQGSGMGIGI